LPSAVADQASSMRRTTRQSRRSRALELPPSKATPARQSRAGASRPPRATGPRSSSCARERRRASWFDDPEPFATLGEQLVRTIRSDFSSPLRRRRIPIPRFTLLRSDTNEPHLESGGEMVDQIVDVTERLTFASRKPLLGEIHEFSHRVLLLLAHARPSARSRTNSSNSAASASILPRS